MSYLSNQDQKITLSEQMVVINLNISVGSGRKKLSEDDLQIETQHKIVNLGSKQLLPRKWINELNKCKADIWNYVKKHGIPFFGQFVIPVDMLPEVEAEINNARNMFEAIKQRMKDDWDSDITEYIRELRVDNCLIVDESEMPDKQTFINSLRFEWIPYQITFETEEKKQLIAEHFDNMQFTLAEGIGDSIRTYIDSSLVDRKRKMSEKSIEPLERIYSKIRSFGMMYPQFKPVGDIVNTAISDLRGMIGTDDDNFQPIIVDLERVASSSSIFNTINNKPDTTTQQSNMNIANLL